MISVTFRTSGFKELDKALQDLTKATGKGVLRRAGIKAMQPMADIARGMAPRDKGDLAASITVGAKAVGAGADIGKAEYRKVMKGGGGKGDALKAMRGARREAKSSGKASAVEVFMGPTKPKTKREAIKAVVQEFGSAKQHPNAYMRPAFEQDKTALVDRLGKEMWAEIEKSAKRAAKKAARIAAKG